MEKFVTNFNAAFTATNMNSFFFGATQKVWISEIDSDNLLWQGVMHAVGTLLKNTLQYAELLILKTQIRVTVSSRMYSAWISVETGISSIGIDNSPPIEGGFQQSMLDPKQNDDKWCVVWIRERRKASTT